MPSGSVARRRSPARFGWSTLAVLSLGGALGALARYAVAVVWTAAPSAFPWATLAVNVVGCSLLGALMTLVERRCPHRLLRPFLGVGLIGGFTTFSTYVVDALAAARVGAEGVALLYLAGTLVAALGGTALGAAGTGRLMEASSARRP